MAAPKKVTSKSAWKKAAVHDDVTLPSGVIVSIKIPNLPELVTAGEFPNHLVDTAISVASGTTKVNSDHVKEQAEFHRHLVYKTVVEPALDLEDVKEIPTEDVELLVALATRQRDVDAVGRHIAGLDDSEEWRRFRGLSEID